MQRKLSLILISVTMIFCLASAPCQAAGRDDITELLSDFTKETKCDRVSMVVYDNDEFSFYGDSEGIYQIGSMTKAFTGLAVNRLISEGRFSLQSNVSDLLPGFLSLYGGSPVDITVDMLLSQTSGYTNDETDYPSAEPGMTLNEWADSISGKELASAPGEKYAYSNVNYNLLGVIIEKVTGLSYKEYMESEILYPLGLYHTFVGYPGDRENVTEGSRLAYRTAFDYKVPVREGTVPAGYFYSDAKDMGRWIEIWTGNADIPAEYGVLIGEIKARLVSEGDYFSGWECFDNDTIGHSGGTPNYSSRIVFSKDLSKGVCVLTGLNVAASADSLCNGVYNHINGRDCGHIQSDIWTVFDRIFSLVTIAAAALCVFAFLTGKPRILIIVGILCAVLFVSLSIVMPLIFKAGLDDILFTWAPLSLFGAMIMLFGDSVICFAMAMKRKKHNEN